MRRGLSEVLAGNAYDPTRLVQILRGVMELEGYISPANITEIAAALQLPRSAVEGVAGFYSFFETEPQGRYRVHFSDNITDEMQGSVELRARLLDAFQLQLGEVSRDGRLSVKLTSCTGMCDQGPAMLINGRPIARLTPARIGAICSLIRGGSPVDQWPDNLFTVDTHIERADRLLTTPVPPGGAIDATLARGAEETLALLRRSELRGRGGAGFGTGQKWTACAAAPGPDRYVVCNADEGEPGTFKDRVLLMHHADALLEGMTVAALAIGAREGFLYLRAEYPFLKPTLEATLAARRQAGLLGRDIRGVRGLDFDVKIHMGAGAYVCGEETALIESLEGHRGIPRNRPPYPVTRGYLGRPTVVNNVETLIAAAQIAIHGDEWFRSLGTARSAGTKVLSVSGDVARPGIYEVPFGVTVSQVLADAGAERTQAVQVGGPSGTLLARKEFGRRIAFEDVPSAGAFMVFDETRDMVRVIDNFARFFAHESCGFCTPCRVGTTLVKQMMAHMAAGQGSRRHIKDLARVSRVMGQTSQCGLGASAGNPILDGLEKFEPAFYSRLPSLEVRPVFDLDASLAPAREATGRDDAGAHFDPERG